MINVIWQTKKDDISILGDETNGQFEYIEKVIFKNVDHINYFDNKEYITFLNNSIIIYSSPDRYIDNDLKKYLEKYDLLKLKYILFHLSNEILNHNCDYYNNAEHVFRFYYDNNIKKSNVTTLPLGFVSGYINNSNDINLSNNRDILISFIGQVKSDRKILVNIISNIKDSFLHLTTKWNCPNCLTSEEVINIYKRTKFIPCPMGWCNPDSLRIFESLEWGCIPIIKKYNNIDYFEYIFGKHPIPVVNDWNDIIPLMNELNNDNIDDLIITINKWYKNYMDTISKKVKNIINIKINNNEMFKEKTILITGGSGSWGNELTTQLLEKNPSKIIIFSRGELAQVNMDRKFNDDRIQFVIGDVRDFEMVNRVCKGVDYVFHLAALKHVPVCENQPQEAIKTNINGTTNLINACINNGVKKFIDVSTDKAVSPSNLYGMTKSIGEKLTIQANKLSDKTDFVCIRGGNVLGSNGSVVPHFINQIKTMNKVTITDSTMTRFFLTLPEAISILFQAVEYSVGGETYVMNMPSFYIKDLAKVLVKYYGNEETKIDEIGIREGEKIHEVLVSEHESKMSYTFNNDYYVVLPEIKTYRDYSHINKDNKVNFNTFSSSDNIKDEEYLFHLLMEGGFLKNN